MLVVFCLFLLYYNFRGLYMTINDRGHIHDLLCNWPEKDVKVEVLK